MSDKDKAAPVGEREAFEAWARAEGYNTTPSTVREYLMRETCDALKGFQAGAAHQRQQAQSAEDVGEVVVTRTSSGEILAVTRQDDEGRVISIIAQSVSLAVPDRKKQPDGFVTMPSHYEGWNACLDEFARLNKGAGSHE